MTTRWVAASMLMIGLGAGPAPGYGQVPGDTAVGDAERFIGLLKSGDWAAAEGMVAPALRDRLGAAQLELVWGQLGASLGELGRTRLRGVTAVDSMSSVELYGDFARDTVLVRVVLSPAREVSGFWIGPVPDAAQPLESATPSPASQSSAPPYADATRFREEEVRVGVEPWVLPGTLTVPADPGRYPAVVLVHGSGPHDRDETVGGTKVFRDVAWGLATRGVVVLRYEKRTRVHGARMGADVTIESEVIDDALAALARVRTHPSVDPERAYVAGHSLGAQLAPEIARRDDRVAGVIMLAASARPLDEVIVEQLEYLGGLQENASPEAQAQLKAVLEQVQRLSSGEVADTEVVLGATGSYFRALAARNAVAEARALDVPLLLLQGERDYQVTTEDFGIWQNALKDRPAASFRSFPSLNHLFVAGSGPSRPAEYMEPGFVAEDVIEAIHAWIADGGRSR